MNRKFWMLFVALLLGVVQQAHAFRMVVVDPDFTDINSISTSIPLTACPNSLSTDPLFGYSSCAYGFNETHATITDVSIFIDASSVPSQYGPGACGTTGNGQCTISDVNNGYLFNFSGLSVTSQNTLIIGLDLPIGTLDTLDVTIAQTPEPASFWLLASGCLISGSLAFWRRRTHSFGQTLG